MCPVWTPARTQTVLTDIYCCFLSPPTQIKPKLLSTTCHPTHYSLNLCTTSEWHKNYNHENLMRGQRRNTHAHHTPTTYKWKILWWTMECCETSYNMHMDPRANSYCINWHTSNKQQIATASIDILQINKKVSRLALGHIPASYLMGTAKADDEYISTPHMPPWCEQGNTLPLPLLQAKLCPSPFWDLLW